MNPLNRKMFRQPGMSRQPMGILASSPQLANVVRQRMGQPVQMAHGGYHPPRSPMGRVSTSRRPVPGSVRIPLIDLLPKSGFARPALDDFLASSGAARASAPGVVIPSGGLGSLSSPPVMSVRGSGRSRPAGATNVTSVDMPRSGMRSIASRPVMSVRGTGSSVDASPLIDQGIAAAKSAVSGDFMRPLTDAIVRDVGSDVSSIASFLDTDTRMSPANVAARARIPTMDDNVDDAAMLQAEIDKRAATDTAGEFTDSVPTTAAEQIANAARPRPVSTIVDENLDPGARAEAEAAARREIAAGNVDPGEQQGLVGTEGDAPKKKGKKTNVELAIDLAEGYEQADADASKTVVGAKTSEAANDAIASALQTQNSPDASDKDKADATDAAVGIKGTRKERVKARQALLKELLGEDQAKDIRGDAGYNLMMVGLMMAAGESPDALTNFANAAAKGLQNFATVRAERSEAKRKEDRAIALKAIDEVGAEISEEEKRAYDNQVRADSRRHDIALQEQRDVAALQRLDRQLTSAEQRQVDEFNFKRELNSRTFRQNIATLGIKAENAENLQRLQNDFSRELQTLKNQEDSAAIKTARAIQAANPELYPTLGDAYAATQSSTKPTDEQQRYNRLVASGMQPSQAIIFAQAGVTSEMFKQLGPEEAQERIGGLMGGGQTTAPATVTISDLPQSQQDKILAFEVGAPIKTKQGTYIRTNAGTLVPVAR